MRQTEFKKLIKELNELAQSEMNLKQPEYTNQSSDILHNFKTTGERLNVNALKVWGIFMEKQVQSIIAHVNDANLKQSEKIDSRFADIINYAYLGLALFKERSK